MKPIVVHVLSVSALVAAGLALAAAPAQAVPPTSTSIGFTSSPTVQVGTPSTLVVTVTAADGVTQPVGGVVFTNLAGVNLGSSSTARGGSISSSTATLLWFPNQATTYSFNATFYPTDSALLSSSVTVTPFTVRATPSGLPVAIAATQMYNGIPTTMTATVFPSTLTGSVAFTRNGNGLSPSMPIVNGSASYTFTPTSLGWQEFGVSFTASNSPGTQGVATQWVNVLAPLGTDDISLNPTPTSLSNGQSAVINPTTIAGATPVLSVSGGCTLSGNKITAIAGTGACTVTGNSPSTGAYLAALETWTIPLTPGTQTAARTAPTSGNMKVGATLRLAHRTVTTNAGQPVIWRITSGKSHCSLTTTGSGRTTLRLESRGTCKVRASAAAITGQWAALVVPRGYTAK